MKNASDGPWVGFQGPILSRGRAWGGAVEEEEEEEEEEPSTFEVGGAKGSWTLLDVWTSGLEIPKGLLGARTPLEARAGHDNLFIIF